MEVVTPEVGIAMDADASAPPLTRMTEGGMAAGSEDVSITWAPSGGAGLFNVATTLAGLPPTTAVEASWKALRAVGITVILDLTDDAPYVAVITTGTGAATRAVVIGKLGLLQLPATAVTDSGVVAMDGSELLSSMRAPAAGAA